MRILGFVAFIFIVAACGDSGTSTTTLPVTTAPPSTTTTAPPEATTPPSTVSGPTTTAAATTLPPTTTITEPPTTTTVEEGVVVIEVEVAGGEVAGEDRYEVDGGDLVRITVTSDIADEVHVHGYDVFGDVAPGAPVVLEFTADIPGIFEVELEQARRALFELVVGA